ncbi:hypothetical protein PROFUN_05119 [Planoprotostelium fungivorum]|uniref:PITH domain-containing protein n=1 Tax=Planoprotostelium fungivorum TaxID=1890364 RepID=A0A2P6NRV0_9EUKA|nr:hypothetical protein PROFUN_05119 [Planoprotostelium fungivorum]
MTPLQTDTPPPRFHILSHIIDMGIPKFYAWLSRECPSMIRGISSDSILTVDNLYLDLNGVFHRSREVVISLSNLVLTASDIIDVMNPNQRLYLAVDGVPPAAKISQQRQRRLQYVAKRKQRGQGVSKPTESVQVPTEQIDEESQTDDIDSFFHPESFSLDDNGDAEVAITPGSGFMYRLSLRMSSWIRHKIVSDERWKKPKIFFSGVEVPGEGEHKIMDFIRDLQRQGISKESHCIYGLDADLLMLGLSTHEERCMVLRESPFQRHNPSQFMTRELFQLVDFSVLRTYIDEKLEYYNAERIVDDFILTLFLCGNDFLPAVPTLDIREGALHYFFGLYTDVLSENMNGGKAEIHWSRLRIFMEKLAALEEAVLKERLVQLKRSFPEWKNVLSRPETPRNNLQPATSQSNETMDEPLTLPGGYVMVDLAAYIDTDKSEILGVRSSQSVLEHFMMGTDEMQMISSDADDQILIKIGMTQKKQMKLHTIYLDCPSGQLPSRMEIYINRPNIGFSDLSQPQQKLSLQFQENSENFFPLDFVKMQNVSHVTILLDRDGRDDEITSVRSIILFGLPTAGLDMSKLKRVPRRRWRKRKHQTQTTHQGPSKREIQDLMTNRGLAWNYQYYCRGCTSWNFIHPQHYAPTASDIVEYLLKNSSGPSQEFELGNPLTPLAHLLAVLPKKNIKQLPPTLRQWVESGHADEISTDEDALDVDVEGARFPSECKILLPFIDVKR